MINSHDPVLAAEMDEWGRITLWHMFFGLFLWEFFTTLDYEWKVLFGHIPYRWTIWVYSITRIASLISVALEFIEMNIMTPVNCQLWASLLVTSSYLAMAAASLLIVLRIIAIWDKNKVVTVMAVSVWGVNVVFLIEGAARLRSDGVPLLPLCVIDANTTNVPTFISTAATDIILLLIMLIGLLGLRRKGGGTFGLAQILWKQGLAWFLLATLAEIPPAVLPALNLSNKFAYIFQLPAVVTMAVAATRMHRSLVHFVHGPPEAVRKNVQLTRFKFATTKPPRTTTISLNPTEMSARSVYEQYPTALTGDHDFSIDYDEKGHERPSGFFDEDVERGE